MKTLQLPRTDLNDRKMILEWDLIGDAKNVK